MGAAEMKMVAAWIDDVSKNPTDEPKLAKIAEHRLSDRARAYVLTDQALDMARRQGTL